MNARRLRSGRIATPGRPRAPSERRPHVAIFVDATGAYGRGLLRGIADYLEVHGPWSLFVDPRATGRIEPALLRRWRGDGVLAFIEDPLLARQLARLRLPIVETYGHLPDLHLPWVGNDDQAIGRMAAAHLLDRRLSNFAFSGYPQQAWSERRRSGFAQVVKQAGFDCREYYYPRSFSSLAEWEEAQRQLAIWLTRLPKPVGLMACSDRHAREVLNISRHAGLIVPEQVAVIGSGNDEVVCRLCDPPLSSVADDPQRIGYEAAQLLDGLITRAKRPRGMTPRLIAPVGVVARQSTDMFAIDDPAITTVLRFIREHACQRINVADVVRQARVSRSVLYRRFHRAVGRSMHEEVLRVRIDRVKELLTYTSLSQERIAPLTGFDHPEYMVVVFRRYTGMTPGAYRAAHRPEAGAHPRHS